MQQTGLFWPEGIPHFGALSLIAQTKKKSLRTVTFWLSGKLLEVVAQAKLIASARTPQCCDIVAAAH
jgi:hypothetical protein